MSARWRSRWDRNACGPRRARTAFARFRTRSPSAASLRRDSRGCMLNLRDAVVFAGSMAAIAALAAVPRVLPAISPMTVALALLLVVLGAATLSRLGIAIVVSIVAMLVLNFFFLPPVGTFTIADPENWVALFAFLIVAVIASKLSDVAQERTREAVSRRNEVTRLFDLSRDVLLTTETTGGLEALARHISRRFELARVAVCLPADHGWDIYQGGEIRVVVAEADLEKALA